LNPLAADLDEVLERTAVLWKGMRNARLLITGGTGFFGCWLLETLLWADRKLGLDASVTVLSRYPEAFREKVPHLACNAAVTLHSGDVRTFAFPGKRFTHIIHGATDASATMNAGEPLEMLDTIVEGTRRTLSLALACGASRYLLLSSGAVYGKAAGRVDETCLTAPDMTDPLSAYGEGKRLAEWLCAVCRRSHGLETTIARGFAFVGPYLPLYRHFAIGNFIADALEGGPIRVKGDGTAVRSYLYAADLAVWLWTILLQGEAGRVYNVGAEEDLTTAQLARAVAAEFTPPPEVRIEQRPVPDAVVDRYVPSTERARRELGVEAYTPLGEAIRKTSSWVRENGRSTVGATR